MQTEMPRRPRDSRFETRTARSRLKARKKAYNGPQLAPGIFLDYRRCKGPGRWVVRAATGKGSYWCDTFSIADDNEDADGVNVLTFWQAQDRARALARGHTNCERNIADKALRFIGQGIIPGCFLYRHYHPSGALLYVGISLHALARQRKHFQEAEWRTLIHRIIIEPFATRDEALEAEQLAIKTEFPKFNTSHNERRYPLAELPQLEEGPTTSFS